MPSIAKQKRYWRFDRSKVYTKLFIGNAAPFQGHRLLNYINTLLDSSCIGVADFATLCLEHNKFYITKALREFKNNNGKYDH